MLFQFITNNSKNNRKIFNWFKLTRLLSSSTCALTGFFWLLSHVIYLKLTKVLYECLLINFTKLQFLNNKIYSYTKNNYLALGNLVFWSISSLKTKSKHLSQFFWWEINLRELRGFILQKIWVLVAGRQKKKFCHWSLDLGRKKLL